MSPDWIDPDSLIAQGQRTLRGVAGAIPDIGANARLFALANLSAADAIITAWNAKQFYNYWRAITAIQEGDNDGNPNTARDPNWVPLVVTPAYPDYTSGANSFIGAFTRTLALLLGDERPFTVTNLPRNETKTYQRLSDVAADMVEVRIYQGIHFRSADAVARRVGKRSADWAASHVLRPVGNR